MQIFVNLLGMPGYYLCSIVKLGGSLLNQEILMYEKRNIEFMFRENDINFWQLKLKIYRTG